MSIEVMTMVFKAHFGSVSLNAVALKLADHAHDDGSSVYPAKSSVAVAAEVSVPTVKRAIKLFVQKGLLFVVREGGKGPGDPTEYAFNLELLRSMKGGSTPLAEFPDYEPDADPVGSASDHGEQAKGVTVNPLSDEKGGHGEPLRGVARGSPDHAKGVTGDRKGGHSLNPKPSGTIKEPCSQARAGANLPNDAHPDDGQLLEVLLEAAGPAARSGAKGLGSVAVIRKWLDQGADLQRDILPAIREKAATMNPGSLRSWKFMDGPIGDWMQDRRQKPDTRPAAACKLRDPATLQPRQWRGWVIRWIDGGHWYAEKGPEPGEPGCLVPIEVIADVLKVKGADAIARRRGRPA